MMRGGDETCVRGFGAEEVRAFCDHLLHAAAFAGAEALSEQCGGLLQAFDLPFCLAKTGGEEGLEFWMGGGAGHFGHGFEELLFAAVEAAHFILEKVFENVGFHAHVIAWRRRGGWVGSFATAGRGGGHEMAVADEKRN